MTLRSHKDIANCRRLVQGLGKTFSNNGHEYQRLLTVRTQIASATSLTLGGKGEIPRSSSGEEEQAREGEGSGLQYAMVAVQCLDHDDQENNAGEREAGLTWLDLAGGHPKGLIAE